MGFTLQQGSSRVCLHSPSYFTPLRKPSLAQQNWTLFTKQKYSNLLFWVVASHNPRGSIFPWSVINCIFAMHKIQLFRSGFHPSKVVALFLPSSDLHFTNRATIGIGLSDYYFLFFRQNSTNINSISTKSILW